jgi:hypothetical protein
LVAFISRAYAVAKFPGSDATAAPLRDPLAAWSSSGPTMACSASCSASPTRCRSCWAWRSRPRSWRWWPALQRVEGTFVDAALRSRQSDLLFTAQLAGQDVLLYVLAEHKSAPERFTALQMARYVMLRFLRLLRWLRPVAALHELLRWSPRVAAAQREPRGEAVLRAHSRGTWLRLPTTLRRCVKP